MAKFNTYPLLATADLNRDDYLVFASGSNTYKITAENVLGAISAITEATEAQQIDATTVFTPGGNPKTGPFSDILSFADTLRRMPLNQYPWSLYAVGGDRTSTRLNSSH